MKTTKFPIETMRHSGAHLMAAAIHRLWPDAQFGVGPPIDNGFYYDVLLSQPVVEEDLVKIEAEMRRLKKKRLPFSYSEVPISTAIEQMQGDEQPFKVELLHLLKHKGSTAIEKETGDANLANTTDTETVTLWQVGNFVDLCRGPHVDRSDQIGTFKLTRLAGAYWRGDSRNQQLQRIYALCYEDEEQLKFEFERLEQLRLRDHRVLGKQMSIFTFSEEVGSGLPIWLPNGVVLRDELSALAMEFERKYGYQRVITPELAKGKLYHRSGHLPYYQDEMYRPIMIDEEDFYLRPMNCPHHHQVYLSELRSYRNLPLRISEYGNVYRYEPSGALSGLMRTRGFCQNDAHIYCRYDQAQAEFTNVMLLHADYYRLLGIEAFYMRLSLPDLEKIDKYVNEPAQWIEALGVIRNAMLDSGLDFTEVEGEAAFYGPKIDFQIKSVTGTEYTISTNQLDFLASQRFDLNYIGVDGKEHPVYVIHRAPLGSHERFVAFLLEHYAGAFPMWLAPEQVRIIPVSDRHIPYAHEVQSALFNAAIHTGTGGLRVTVDGGQGRMQKKIRNAEVDKVPYMLVIGDRELAENTVSVRLRARKDLGSMRLAEVITRFEQETKTRKDIIEPDFTKDSKVI